MLLRVQANGAGAAVLDDNEEQKPKPAKATDGQDDGSNRDKLVIEVWKQAVDTQKHFNDMCAKSRQLGLTFVAASLGAAIFLFTRTNTPANYAFTANICGRDVIIHIAPLIVLAALAAVYAVKKLDLGVYHQMLRGAVAFNEDLEKTHLQRIVGLKKGMTEAISHFSRHSDADVEPGDSGTYVYSGDNFKSARQKLSGFYNFVMIFLAFAAIAMFVASNFLKAVG